MKEWMFWLFSWIPGNGAKLKRQVQTQHKIREYVGGLIEVHQKEFNPQEEPTNYIQAYTLKQRENTPTFDDRQLLAATGNLFSAGMETTSNTLRWCILYCIRHPDVQERVHQEIVSVCGTEAPPGLQHRSELPYTEAVLLEAQRIGSSVPLAIREATQDIYYKGIRIPKGAVLIGNIWAVHNDPHNFPNPREFLPERFINKETGKLDRNKANEILPFGAGKRLCLGESLARMEMFLIFAALLQRFKFRVPHYHCLPTTEPLTGIVSQPRPFKLVAELRD
jgi:cytochrome P450 family 2 subfamily U polypeptide 1